MLELNHLRADPALSEDGVWADFFGARFLIARHNNPKAEQLRSRLTLEAWEVISSGGEEAKNALALVETRTLATAVLLGWENVGMNGEILEYSPEVAEGLLADPALRDLRQFIENFSFNRGNYREKAEAEVSASVKGSAAS